MGTLNEILDKKENTDLDKVTAYILHIIERLHTEEIPLEDMKEIKSKICEIWRKHHPLDTLLN